jgi:hypothetical protein
MTLTFYKTGFDVTKNGVYEDLEKFLGSLDYVLKMEYKHLDPALNQQVKLPISSHQLTKKNIGDYCRAEDEEGMIYYYYVMNCQWKGKETLLVTLGLDTLNTFWKEISSSWTAETHITRRFKDRWFKSRTYAAPKVDRKEEDFGTVPMKRVSVQAINPAASIKKWTLVYMTEYTSEEELNNNPITCYCFPSSDTSIDTALVGDVTFEPTTLPSVNRCYMSNGMNAGDAFTATKTDGSTASFTIGDNCACVLFYPESSVIKLRVWRYADDQTSFTDYSASKMVFSKCKRVYLQSVSYTGVMGAADFSHPFEVNAGESVTTLTNFSEWYEANKTDARLVKIRELPYAPFKETYSDNKLTIPSGWEINGVGLKFNGAKFGSYFLATRKADSVTLAPEDIVDRAPDIKFETKLYNSAFYADKLVYDSSTWVAKWETYNSGTGKITSGDFNLGVNYAVSDGIDNGSLFKVIQGFEYDTDFGDYMVIDKSTDIPYYTNEYLNYIRYGKYYDEKAANLNIASSMFSGVGSAASTVASFAFSGATVGSAGGPFGATGGTIAGVVIGLATTAMSMAKTCATAYDTINSKMDTYAHQASSVSGTSDVSLLNIYSGNKLLSVIYEPVDDIKQLLYDYFRLYGYADDCYEIPTFTRRYVDFLKLEPAFKGDLLWNDFLDDIKARMQLGFRVFHRVNESYDLLFEKENWETSLWSWAGND